MAPKRKLLSERRFSPRSFEQRTLFEVHTLTGLSLERAPSVCVSLDLFYAEVVRERQTCFSAAAGSRTRSSSRTDRKSTIAFRRFSVL